MRPAWFYIVSYTSGATGRPCQKEEEEEEEKDQRSLESTTLTTKLRKVYYVKGNLSKF